MNVLAVLVAAISSFILGGLWYSSRLFGPIWNTENGGVFRRGHPVKVFGLSLLFSLIAATCFAFWVGPAPALPNALRAGALAGAGFVAASFGINYQFAQRSYTLWLIDAGYHTMQFLFFALIIGLWH
jgi:hypothetical protein